MGFTNLRIDVSVIYPLLEYLVAKAIVERTYILRRSAGKVCSISPRTDYINAIVDNSFTRYTVDSNASF